MLTKLVWPIFWLIVILIFYKEIKSLLSTLVSIGNKAKKISYMGGMLDLGTNPDLLIGSQQLETKQYNLSKAYQSTIITAEENTIRTQLVEAGFTNEQGVNILIHHLAYKNLFILFLIIDKFIYQEQIQLISNLNSQIKPQTESDLKKYYDVWKEKYQNDDFTYQQFLKFLLDQSLIAEQLNGYYITVLGKEYLSFLIKFEKPIT